MNPQVPGYTIQREVGKGGMGVVYRALRNADGASVAIKILLPHMVNAITSRRFQREGQALKSLDHPNIVRVFEVGCREGVHYLAMEFLEGVPLSRVMRTHGVRLPLPSALAFARQVARALAAIHERGMTHRDLKPSNVIVCAGDTAKLLDFGLVQVEGLTMLTATGNVVGTPAYMSPEQCDGTALDHRTDIYSFGVMLYELVCGVPPFHSESVYDLLEMQRRSAPASPRARRRDLPHECEQLILRCLEKAPGDRPQSMQEVLACLGDAAPPGAATCTPEDAGAARPGSRRRTRVLTLFALVALLAAAISWALDSLLAGLRTRVAEALGTLRTAGVPATSDGDAARLAAIAQAAAAHHRGRAAEAGGDFEDAYESFREAHDLCGDRIEYVHALVRIAGKLNREREVVPRVAAYLATPASDDPGSMLKIWLDEKERE
ncbi:MAG: serine/threonine protein kinase [Planctomycetes bacterium]|nr:serine/threonine protein kinase [Planctomycetota bacterium]